MSIFRFSALFCVAFVFVATFNSSRMLAPIRRELSNTGIVWPSHLRSPSTRTVDQRQPKLLEYVLPATKIAPPLTAAVEPKQLELVHIPKTDGIATEVPAEPKQLKFVHIPKTGGTETEAPTEPKQLESVHIPKAGGTQTEAPTEPKQLEFSHIPKTGAPATEAPTEPKQLEYVYTFKTGGTAMESPVEPKQLEFVHIPKTGGTAIEYAASLANITWGLCHWKSRPFAGPGCHHPDWAGYDSRQNLSGHEINWEHWHVPPRHQTSLQSPYKNKTLFAVVRNPYERFISEFYCPYTGWNPVDWTQEDLGFIDPMGKPLEDALQDAMRKAADGEPDEPRVKKPETPNALNYFLMQRLQWFVKWTAHYLPQSDYVYDKDGVRIVDHVLKYEELRQEFADLMDHYDLPIFLNSTVNQQHDDKKRVRLTVMDLFPETIQRINEVARKDFLNFGYSMIDPKHLALQRAEEGKVQRVYYINLLKNTQRRDLMESWLRLQPLPYERINATIGSSNPQDCVAAKQHLDRCRGLSGLAKTELDIIRNHNTSGLTLVFEDDFVAYEPLDEIVERTLKMVPSDWDIIRWDCWGEPSDLFDVLSPGKVFRTYANVTSRNRPGWYCGGTHAMLWREESISKLEQLWSREPFDDIDCRLTTESLNSYCVNIGIGGLEKVTVERSDIPKIDSSF